MVEINGQARIKLSQDVEKVTMPGHKTAYRLYGGDGHALIDLLQKVTEPAPEIGQKVLCRHPFQESKRAYVIPTRVESLYRVNIIFNNFLCFFSNRICLFLRFTGIRAVFVSRYPHWQKYANVYNNHCTLYDKIIKGI